jgi:hypothetical protein
LEVSNFFFLGQSAMKWVVSPHSKQLLGDLLLSLWNLCNAWNFLASRAISSSGMLSYYSSEAAHKEDKANFNDFHAPYRIIKSIQQLFSTLIIRISKRIT